MRVCAKTESGGVVERSYDYGCVHTINRLVGGSMAALYMKRHLLNGLLIADASHTLKFLLKCCV